MILVQFVTPCLGANLPYKYFYWVLCTWMSTKYLKNPWHFRVLFSAITK